MSETRGMGREDGDMVQSEDPDVEVGEDLRAGLSAPAEAPQHPPAEGDVDE